MEGVTPRRLRARQVQKCPCHPREAFGIDTTHERVTKLKMKSPDVNSGDQVIRDRRSKHIAEDEAGADYEGGRRDHREGVYEGTLTRQSQ